MRGIVVARHLPREHAPMDRLQVVPLRFGQEYLADINAEDEPMELETVAIEPG